MESKLIGSTLTQNDTQQKIKIAVAQGDGIGPEIMEATLTILEAANANIEPDFIELGEQVYLSGNTSEIRKEA